MRDRDFARAWQVWCHVAAPSHPPLIGNKLLDSPDWKGEQVAISLAEKVEKEWLTRTEEGKRSGFLSALWHTSENLPSILKPLPHHGISKICTSEPLPFWSELCLAWSVP